MSQIATEFRLSVSRVSQLIKAYEREEMKFLRLCRLVFSGHQLAAREGLQIQGLPQSIPDPIESLLQAITSRYQQLIGFGNNDANTPTSERKSYLAKYSVAA